MVYKKQVLSKKGILLTIILLYALYVKSSEASIKFELYDTTVTWSGCLYKKFAIFPSEESRCSACAMNGTRNITFRPSLSEAYINCTSECPKATICTRYKYNLGGIIRPQCYQCENTEKEDIKFRFHRIYRICSEACKECAKSADLAQANHCAFKCGGNPTFCYPYEVWLGHQKCYQSSKMFGCTFEEVHSDEIAEPCYECALEVDKKDAQHCTAACDGVPHYHIEENGKKTILQCKLGSYNEIFEHDIPRDILRFLKVDSTAIRSKIIPSVK